nr:TrmB family transcriptional regulator [Actinomycetota bacterium]
METSDAVAQLSRLGLTSYEAKAYLALTRRDSSTAAQASRLAGVPR